MESEMLNAGEVHQAYNALDSAVTLRVHERLSSILAGQNNPHARTSYHFIRAMQAPALDMMRRGVAINTKVRQDETQRYQDIRTKAQALLDRLADTIWGPEQYSEVVKTRALWTPVGKRGQVLSPRLRTNTVETPRERPRGLNASSDKQCLAFFNIALGLPVAYEIRKTPAGTVRTPTANNKALKTWAGRRSKGPGINPRDQSVPPVNFAAPFISLILTIREASKMLQVLQTPLDSDSRMRCSYNVAGTENARWSSSKNVRGNGTNLQNITSSMRRMFCADDGHYFISTDLEQAESRLVAGLVWQLTGSRAYLNACLSGDLHTAVARMTWPELPWTDDPKHNRTIANSTSPELPRFTYRDIAKRLGHGSNYRGSPYGIAQAVGIPAHLVEDFQRRYFLAFPAILEWHRWVAGELVEHRYLDTPLGRRRHFFSRPTDDSTIREAIAYAPQSAVGELLNLIMYKAWERSILPNTDPKHLPIQLLLQNHDAFAFQTPVSSHLPNTISAIDAIFNSTPVPFSHAGESLNLLIPGEFVSGFNWGYADDLTIPRSSWTYTDGNPDGLSKWRGSETRIRQQSASPRPADWFS